MYYTAYDLKPTLSNSSWTFWAGFGNSTVHIRATPCDAGNAFEQMVYGDQHQQVRPGRQTYMQNPPSIQQALQNLFCQAHIGL